MSWIEKSEMYSRTSSRTSSASTDTSPKLDNEELNLTLYGESVPLRRTRTIIQRAKGRTLRTLSLVPGATGGAAKLLAENTTLDLGFTMRTEEIDSFTNPYKPIGESSSSNRTSTYFSNRRESDSSDIVESEQSDACTSKDGSSIESSPAITPLDNPGSNISRSSTCTSWTTDEYSVKSEHGSTSKNIDDLDSNGEWNNFWKKYNNSLNLKTICTDIVPSLPIDDLNSCTSSRRSSYLDCSSSKKKVSEKKSPQIQKVIMSTADAIEAASCARRLSEILSSAIRRSSLPCTNKDTNERNLLKLTKNIEESIPQPPPLPLSEKLVRSKSESELPNVTNITSEELQNKKLSLKPLSDDCVEVEIQSTDPLSIAELLKKVLNQRRDIIMPREDSPSACQSHRSDWSSFDEK